MDAKRQHLLLSTERFLFIMLNDSGLIANIFGKTNV